MEQEGRSESPGSEALQIFRLHTDNLRYLLEVIVGDTGAVAETSEHTVAMTEPTFATAMNLAKTLSDSTKPDKTLVLAQLSTSIAELKKSSEDLVALVQTNAQTHRFLFDWMLVMAVTFAEAYLEGALLLLTTTRPEWMATKDKVVSGDDVLKRIELALPAERRWQELMEIMRQGWTKQFLRDKPGKWISRLQKFGAPKYRKGLDIQMAAIWKRRDMIVHAAPAALAGYLTGSSKSAAASFVESKSEFQDALSVIFGFVEATDAFVVRPLNAKRSA